MKIGIQTWGSEGDIRPFVALGLGLKQAGHEVRLVVTDIEDKDYAGLSRQLGFDIVPVGTPVFPDRELLDQAGLDIVNTALPALQFKKVFRHLFEPAVDAMVEGARQLCSWAEVAVGHFLHYPLTVMAEKAGIPHVAVTLAHVTIPSRHLTPQGLPNLGPWGNQLGWWMVRKVVNWPLLGPSNRLRLQEGLARVRDVMDELWVSRPLNLIAVSPSICRPQPDWGPEHAICGFLSLPEDSTPWQPPAELEAFLAGKEPPVFFTLGSATPRRDEHRREIVSILTEASRLAGCRAIIQLGNDGAFPTDRRVHYLPAAPHQAIFPRCSAVVYHGGAGTTQTALRAGVPVVPIPHLAEQEFWTSELQRLGVSPGGVHRRRLTAARLAKKLRAVQADHFRENARRLGERILNEDGVARAVELIQDRLR